MTQHDQPLILKAINKNKTSASSKASLHSTVSPRQWGVELVAVAGMSGPGKSAMLALPAASRDPYRQERYLEIGDLVRKSMIKTFYHHPHRDTERIHRPHRRFVVVHRGPIER